ncbi:MAG: transcriptional repressor [Nitrospinota bacterium]|nr:MAG: transcriptional repressor [Nitrospinota bacterium]
MLSKGEADKVRVALEANGQRFTHQRAAVYACLQRTTTHPTAEEIYLQVKKDLPAISLATVYKALEALVAAGLASKLVFGDHSARYDSRTDKHYHARCLGCGTIQDLPATVPSPFPEPQALVEGFLVTEYRVEWLGYCAQCRPQYIPDLQEAPVGRPSEIF